MWRIGSSRRKPARAVLSSNDGFELPRHEQAAAQQIGARHTLPPYSSMPAAFGFASRENGPRLVSTRRARPPNNGIRPGMRQPRDPKRNVLERWIATEQLVTAEPGDRHLQTELRAALLTNQVLRPSIVG